MSVQNQNGIQTLIDGMSQSIDSSLLKNTQYVKGVNIINRGGLPRTRPAFAKLNAIIASGKFQGAATYHLNDEERIVFGVAGHVYVMKMSDLSIIDHGALLSATVDRFFFVHAERYFIVQDGDPSTSWATANWACDYRRG